MKVAVCVAVLMVMVGCSVANVEWGPYFDVYAIGAWHFAAGQYAKRVCKDQDVESVQKCFMRLPECRPLLYYAQEFTGSIYQLFRKYMQDCNIENDLNLNITGGVPEYMSDWIDDKLTGLSFKHDVGFQYNQLPVLYDCLQEKFNNKNAFTDCINEDFELATE